MGACVFKVTAAGKTAEEAFQLAREQACCEYGHGSYTGTIAEKCEFVRIPLPVGRDPYDYAAELLRRGDLRIDDKWGPAGCIQITDSLWLFFGWARC